MNNSATASQQRRCVETNEDVYWLIAAVAVARVEAAAEQAGNSMVHRATQALWKVDLRKEDNPGAWRIVSEFAKTMGEAKQ